MKRKVLIIGAGGTVGQAMRAFLEEQVGLDVAVHTWNRKNVPLEVPADLGHPNARAVSDYLQTFSPDVVLNFSVAPAEASKEAADAVNVHLPRLLSFLSEASDFDFIHASSVMVFTQALNGPYHPASLPDADSGYGLQKKLAEEAVLAASSRARIARIGWQIGADPKQNTMRRFLDQQAKENNGKIRASTFWMPACSRVSETVRSIWSMLEHEPGTYLLDSNRNWSFFEIVSRLKHEYGATNWNLEATDDFCYNQQMRDPRLNMPSLF